MTAVCRVCGKEWNVSEAAATDPKGYVCPICSLRQEYITAGIIKPGKPVK
jgi:rubrerythrin